MIPLVLAIQIALPLTLLLWMGARPARNLIGFGLQAAATGSLLLALALVAQWAVVPWWLPWAYLSIAALLLAWHALRGGLRRGPLWPSSGKSWLAAILSAGLLAVGAGYAVAALAGRTLPPVEAVDISSPLGPGRYLVGSGGSRQVVNAHMRTLDPGIDRYRRWRGQSYALDFFGLNALGVRATGLRPAAPSEYAIFAAPLHAPCSGKVVAAENGMPDFRVPEQDAVNRLGNHVILQCGEAWIVMAHMKQGSLAVAPGQTVAEGDRLGAVGNSGASTEPHLHIHAQRPPREGEPPISGAPLALRLNGRFLVRNDRIGGE